MNRYIILDFGASLLHTHHSRVIKGFAELLSENGENVEIWLPVGSEIHVDRFETMTRKFLLPSYHPVRFEIGTLTSYLPAIIGKLFNLTEKTKLQKYISMLLKRVTYIHTLRMISKLRDTENLILIFPTACPVALGFGDYLQNKSLRIKTIYRLTNTAEKRGYHTVNFDLFSTLESLANSSFLEVRFGFEMLEYSKDFLSLERYSYYSPTPPCQEIVSRNNYKEKNTISFLGMAQRHKGTKWLENLVERSFSSVKNSRICWLIQTEEQVPIALYRLSLKFDIELLPGKLSEENLSNAFRKTDLICLPYDVEIYAKNASALAYRAADNLVPVVTFNGSAFANEIARYGIGLIADSTESFVSSLLEFEYNSDWINKINLYNSERKLANMKLLNFNEK